MAKPTPVQFHLEDKVIVVTGAAQGIGAACAERFVRDGASVALWDVNDAAAGALARTLEETLEQTLTQTFPQTLQQTGQRAVAFHCDVSRKADVDAALGATLAAFGRVDALINNAGTFKAANFLDITPADWDAVLDVNLRGAFLVAQAVAREMVRAAKGGAIVHMSSVNGVMAIPNIASYNVSKGGINQLTRVMALALAEHGIRVNAVAPGTIATELARQAVLGSDAARERIMRRTPLQRLGEPGEVADVCAFLVSSASSYMTGEIVYVDGGRMALNYTVPG